MKKALSLHGKVCFFNARLGYQSGVQPFAAKINHKVIPRNASRIPQWSIFHRRFILRPTSTPFFNGGTIFLVTFPL